MNISVLNVAVTSADAVSRKYLISTDGTHDAIEIAFLQMDGGDCVICASAQVGCAFGCRHCATTYAPKPYIRNLKAEEIVGMVQYIIADANANHPIDVLDFSGVGDCSANWPAVCDASTILYVEGWIGRYTVTSVAPRNWCRHVCQDITAGKLAPEKIMISLHGADFATRRILIPHGEDPWKAAEWWQRLDTAGCRIVLNYVLHQRNSSPEHLDLLAKYIQMHTSWINTVRISPLNFVDSSDLAPIEHLEEFVTALSERLPETRIVRFSPIGKDVKMGCGQMRAIYQSCGTKDE